MKNFSRDSRSSGKGSFAPRGTIKPMMHEAICSQCGKACRVPFRPTGGRPIFCSECFETKDNAGGAAPARFGSHNTFSKPGFGDDKPKFKAACSKCGKGCEVPFRPIEGKMVFCAQCFDKGINAGVKNAGQFHDQFSALNAKLDRILKILAPDAAVTAPSEAAKEDEISDDFNLSESSPVKKVPKKKK